MSVPTPVPHVLFTAAVWERFHSVSPLTLFLFQIVIMLAILGPLHVHMNVKFS